MNVFESKVYPLNYSTDALSIINAMSFKNGDAKVLGSSGLRSQQYAGDYDLYEVVKVKSASVFAKRLQSIVKTLCKTDNVYVGDIKCGSVPDWKVDGADKLKQLTEDGIITKSEYNDAKAVVGKPLIAKREIKFDVVRWKPSEIEAGFVILRNGKSMTLEEAIMSGGLIKLDVVAWMDTRYVEFSIIYEVYVNGKKLNDIKEDIEGSLKEDMAYYKEANPFKYIKRLFAYAKLTNDEKLGDKLTPILNSDLGRMYLLSSDINTLLYLLENYDHLDKERIDRELSGFRQRMGNIYDVPAFIMAEPTFLKTLWKLETLPIDKSGRKTLTESLTAMTEKIETQLADATKPLLRGLKGGTHRTNFLKKNHLEDKGYSLPELAKISGEPLDILQKVYNRGIGAYKTNPDSVRMKGTFAKGVKAPYSKKLSKEQWAMARTYSFLDGNPKHDQDLRIVLTGSGGVMKVALSNDFYGEKDKGHSRITIHTPNGDQMKKFVDVFTNVLRKNGGSAEDINKIKSLPYTYENKNLSDEIPERVEWYDMPEYHANDKIKGSPSMFFFYIKSSPTAKKFINDLGEHLDIEITESTHYLWYPKRPEVLSPYSGKIWTVAKPVMPKYPIYIISKGRWEKRYTSRYLEWANIPYKIVIEEQEYDEYAKVIDPKKIITFKKKPSEKDMGGIPARNFVLDHAKKSGAKRHWILDDNIIDWRRNYPTGNRTVVKSGACFRVVEDYVDRYSNIMLAGHNYSMFVISNALQPITFNTRVYSSILINNDIPFRWRGRYNEDTDLSLRCLKAGYPTVLFNAMVANKVATLSQKGGNTDSVYAVKDALYLKAKSLADQHPDVAIIKKRFGRTHHLVDYTGFRGLERKWKPGVEAKTPHKTNNYGMKAVDGSYSEDKKEANKEAKETNNQ